MNCRQLQSKTNNSSDISDFETNLAHDICLFNLSGTTASKETEDQPECLFSVVPQRKNLPHIRNELVYSKLGTI